MLNDVKKLIRRVVEVQSRLERLFACGEVMDVDPATHCVKLVLRGYDNVQTDWLPVLTSRAVDVKVYALPTIGEQCWALFLPFSGMEKGLVLGATFNRQDTTPTSNAAQTWIQFEDGTHFYYDQAQHHCELNMPAGTLVVTAPETTINSNVTINGNTQINGNTNMDGTLDATGNIHSDADISDATRAMSDDRGIYNAHDHDKNVPPPSNQQ
ncbi:phage baseplate assembly protein V [Pseudoalteromonas luteoviolacea]|uniref:phage baseplate assembly protein V n=1 Tax=Pseudoalteromonas luteoviolacea TaxID=43657 RepID=UPI001152611E|nr:phage baseplate assembly protein V [Pseudoalteromonas luteoviolacea]TQF71786.1 phage baseplate assembly protein V [Pseudoalteromonas luteoviolacea]